MTELEVTGVVGDAYFGGRVSENPPRFIFTAIDARPGPPYLGVFTLLATASLIVCYLPARCAARVDPLVALRQE